MSDRRTGPRRLVVILCLAATAAASCAGSASPTDSATTTPTAAGTSAPGGLDRRGGVTPPAATVVPPPVNACTPARPFAPTDAPQTMTSGGRPRPYLLSVPATYDGTTGTPLVLDLHGFTLSKEIQTALSGLPAKGAAAGMIVVTPDAVGSLRSWNMFQVDQEPDDFAFVDELITTLSQQLCIDPNRIYSTGISNGSAFTAVLACAAPYRFAAIGLVAATVGPTCPPEVKVSVMAFHGTSDPIVPYRGGTVSSPAALGRPAPPAEQAIGEWATHDGCRDQPDETRPAPSVRLLTFTGCDPGYAVSLYALQGAGHTWPGGLDVQRLGIGTYGSTNHDADATDLLLAFFQAHPKVTAG